MTLTEFIREYGSFERPPQIVREMRSRGFSDEDIDRVITIITDTCHHCWDGDSGCQCWNDR